MLWPIPADSADDTRYTDKRTELWGLMKDWCNAACLPDDADLAADLSAVEYGYDAGDAILLERKDDMRRRGLAAPDDGDALALTFAYTLAQSDSATSAARKKAHAGSNDRGVTGRRVGRSHKPLEPLVSKHKTHRDVHVVVALVLPKGRPMRDKARVESLRAILEILIERLVPSGAYATRLVRLGGVAEIYCVFEKETDARRLAIAVCARATWRRPGWASQWSFVLDGQRPWRSEPH
jgi:hypothetical protein